ncbi:MAG: sigma-70 family RNA polymerase sigma factor [Desulfobacula sp.]|nr:sigma-70 family RNA polymerase sigma factor [Desulfobacula sp.]
MDKSNATIIEEQDLVERLKKGQQWAFNQLVTAHQNRLLKIAYGITLDHEESLEIVQDVFLSVFKNINSFRQKASLAGWLRKITINSCLNWKRKWKRRFRWHHDPIDFQTEAKLTNESVKKNDPESLVREKQFEKKVMDATKLLPEKLRVVFVLNNLEGLPYQEISKTLNIKMGTVRSRLHSARKKILDSLNLNKIGNQ